MNAYYKVLKELERLLLDDPDINTVTRGLEIDTNKKDLYGMAHIEILSAGFTGATINFACRVMAMDIRNHSNEPSNDKLSKNDNEDDNLNTMLFVLYRLYQKLQDADGDYRLLSFERPVIGIEKRNNVLDGWIWDFTLEVSETIVGEC